MALLNNPVGVSLTASTVAFFQELLHASGTGAWSHLLPGNPPPFKRTREMNLHSSSQCSILFFFFAGDGLKLKSV